MSTDPEKVLHEVEHQAHARDWGVVVLIGISFLALIVYFLAVQEARAKIRERKEGPGNARS